MIGGWKYGGYHLGEGGWVLSGWADTGQALSSRTLKERLMEVYVHTWKYNTGTNVTVFFTGMKALPSN